jgi:hypothetical protein
MEPEATSGFLEGYGWRIIEDVGFDELANRYLASARRRLASPPVKRMIYAQRV